jgi:hypothetical protein
MIQFFKCKIALHFNMLRGQIHRLPSPTVVVAFLKIAAGDENTVGEYKLLWVYEG